MIKAAGLYCTMVHWVLINIGSPCGCLMRVVMMWEREDARHMAIHQWRETGMMQYMMKMMKMKYQPNKNGSSIR